MYHTCQPVVPTAPGALLHFRHRPHSPSLSLTIVGEPFRRHWLTRTRPEQHHHHRLQQPQPESLHHQTDSRRSSTVAESVLSPGTVAVGDGKAYSARSPSSCSRSRQQPTGEPDEHSTTATSGRSDATAGRRPAALPHPVKPVLRPNSDRNESTRRKNLHDGDGSITASVISYLGSYHQRRRQQQQQQQQLLIQKAKQNCAAMGGSSSKSLSETAAGKSRSKRRHFRNPFHFHQNRTNNRIKFAETTTSGRASARDNPTDSGSSEFNVQSEKATRSVTVPRSDQMTAVDTTTMRASSVVSANDQGAVANGTRYSSVMTQTPSGRKRSTDERYSPRGGSAGLQFFSMPAPSRPMPPWPHGVKVVRLKAAIDKRLTVVDESSSSVLKYKTPHFRAMASVEVPPLLAGQRVQVGWIQVCRDMQFVNVYGNEGITSWEFPELVTAKYRMISDSDGKQYPWYGSKHEVGIREGPSNEPSLVNVHMNDNFFPQVTWHIPSDGYGRTPMLDTVYRKQRFYTFLALRDLNNNVFQILKTVAWMMELLIQVDPTAPLGQRSRLIGPINQQRPHVYDDTSGIRLEKNALNPPNANNSQVLVWRPKHGDPKIVVRPIQTTIDVNRYLVGTRNHDGKLMQVLENNSSKIMSELNR